VGFKRDFGKTLQSAASSLTSHLMGFFRRHQYLLCFLAVLVFCCVMVVRQFMANQAAHVQLREDFILLHDQAAAPACAALYKTLIERLPSLNDRDLVDDLERTSMLVDPKAPDRDDLVWKYYESVKKELQNRSKARLHQAVERAEKR
jgi:hypothetical protein